MDSKNPVKRPVIVVSLAAVELTSRDMLRGILRYIRERSEYALRICLGLPNDPTAEECLDADCCGLITDRWSPKLARLVRRFDIPTVGVNLPHVPNRLIGAVSSLHEEIGRLAADHLAGLGFTSFAYVPVRRRSWWCDERRKRFTEELKQRGFACATYRRGELGAWLKARPQPCAVFASTDLRAREVIDACRTAGLTVPGDIAVMGVDNDEIICETAEPTLTSIEWNTTDVGTAVASLLDRTIRGEIPRPSRPEMFFYVGARLVSRASTFVNLTRDPLVESCRQLICRDLAQKLTTDTLAAELKVPRRTLERRFAAATGHAIHAEIITHRLTLARKLMATHEMPLEAVASRCGFYDVSHLYRMLKRKAD